MPSFLFAQSGRCEDKEISMETSCSYIGKDAFFSSDERKWHSRILKLAEDHPDDVKIIRRPEDNDGCIYARLPADWFKIQPKRTRELTDEQRAALISRLRKSREETT